MLSSSITKAVSGLHAAQKGLQVTGHNISNANTKGYTRQQLLQSESPYQTIGSHGGYTIKVGLGVTQDEIRQIRDGLTDRRLRTENSVLCYYQKLKGVTSDIEALFDEPYGDTISEFLNSFWSQAQKLNSAPDGVEERLSFISSAKVLIDKINAVSNELTEYQVRLNNDVKTAVNRINQILEGIASYNDKISMAEATGDHANDYRDERNLLLDELSQYGHISYYEDKAGRMYVTFEGQTVVHQESFDKMELKQAQAGSPFSIPIWSNTKEKVVNLEEQISVTKENDTGILKGLLIARGNNVFSKNMDWNEVAINENFSVDVEGNAFIVPKVQMLLNQFTTRLVNMVNENFTGTGIGSHLGKQGVQVFVPITGSDLVAGNIRVNPELLEGGGYNKLGTVSPGNGTSDESGNIGDNTIIKNFLNEFSQSHIWNKEDGRSTTSPYQKNSTIADFFSELVTELGNQGAIYDVKANEKNISVTNIENERQAISSVSTDEEFANMLKYQYAYNAASRMITMLDGMLDVVVNRL